MDSFFVIFSRILKNNNYDELTSPFIRTIVDLLNQPSKWSSIPKKFNSFHDLILTFPYFSDENREELINLFQKAQRHYFCLHRFLYRCLATMECNQGPVIDLELHSLRDVEPHNKVILWESRRFYTFRIVEVLRIIKKSLTLSISFFPDPRQPFNPYTNLPFTICSLYKIYYAVKASHVPCSTILQLYYDSGFCIESLIRNHEYHLRKLIVSEFLAHASLAEKADHIRIMLQEFPECVIDIVIHPSFPLEKMVADMRKFLKLYLTLVTEIVDARRANIRRKLRRCLRTFTTSKPMWGRMVIPKSELDMNGMSVNQDDARPVYVVDDNYIEENEEWADATFLGNLSRKKSIRQQCINRRRNRRKSF